MTQDSETLAYDLLLCLFSPKYYKFLLFTIIFHVFKNLFSTHCLTVTKSNSLSVCQSFLTDHWQSLESAHKSHSPHTAYMGQLNLPPLFWNVSHLKIFPLELLGPAIGLSAGPSSCKGKILRWDTTTNSPTTNKCLILDVTTSNLGI